MSERSRASRQRRNASLCRKAALLGAAWLAGCAGAPLAPAQLDEQPPAAALPALAQQLLDALPHDAAVWERYVDPRALYVSEAGAVASKAEVLEGFRPFPPGLAGSIRIEAPRVTDFGNFATIVFDAHERQRVYDQEIEVRYYSSQVWRRAEGRWRMVLAQAGVRARDPAPQDVPARRLGDYAGRYTLAGQREFLVEARGGALYGGSPGTPLQPLIAVGDNVFADAGSPLGVLRIFVRGRDGRVERMIQRRKHADLEWRRQR